MSECVQGLASIETGTLYVRNRVNKRNCTITRTASRSAAPPAPRGNPGERVRDLEYGAHAYPLPGGALYTYNIGRSPGPSTRRPPHQPRTPISIRPGRGGAATIAALAFFAFSFSQPGEGRTAWRTAGGRPGGVPCPVRAARCPAVAPAGPTRAARRALAAGGGSILASF